MRTLEESLARAQTLRDFRFTSPKAFSRSYDFQDIVNLYEEIERLRSGDAPYKNEHASLIKAEEESQ
jgi:hypothetical protein